MPASITFNQVTRPAGTAGLARNDLVIGQPVTCSNTTVETSYTWTLTDVPIRSALIRGTVGTSATFSFTPDVQGTYRVTLRVNNSSLISDNSILFGAVLSTGPKSLSWRYFAAEERREDNIIRAGLGFPSDINTRGWATDSDLQLEQIETSVWETLNAVSATPGLIERLVKTDATTGQIDISLVPGAPPAGAAGGDLSGTYPNPVVARLLNRPLDTTAPTTGDVLKWDGAKWAVVADDAFADGTTGSPGIGFISELSTGVWRPGLGSLAITTSGVTRATFAATNSVLTTNWLPGVDNTLNLGSPAFRWANAYIDNIVTTSMLFPDGTVSSPSIAFANDVSTNTGFYRPAENVIGVATNGGEVARFTADQVLVTAGTALLPSIGITGDPTTGIYRVSSFVLGVASGGVNSLRVASTGIQVVDGSVASPSITFYNEAGADTGLWRPGAGILGVTTDGVERARFTATESTLSTDWIPDTDLARDLGRADRRWGTLYIDNVVSTTPIGVTDHSLLTNLAADDHVQYLLIDGTRAMTGTLRPNAHGTLDLGLAHETTPVWWRAAYVQTVEANTVNTNNLDVGTFASINRAQFAAGSVATPAILLWDSGFYAPVTGELRFESEGSDVLALSPNGGSLTGNWLPSVDLIYNLGHPSFRWGQIHAGEITVDSITTTTPIDHGSLGGLADDDHTQYLLIDGTRAMTGPVLAANGTAANPAISFSGTPGNGFYRGTSAEFFLATLGAPRWGLGNSLIAQQNGASIAQSVANGAFSIYGHITTHVVRPSLSIGNGVTGTTQFTGTTAGQQRGVSITYTVNQAASVSGFSALQIDATNTALGSGAQYLLDAQVGGVTVAGITNGATAATQGRFLAGDGDGTTPSIGFLSAPATKGFYSPTANAIGIITAGSERWRFDGANFYAMVNGATIRMNVANGGINVYGNITSATDDRAGINIVNVSNMTGATGSARHLAVINNVNQSGTAGYTALDISAVETGTGSGAKYLINAKAGAAGTTQMFAVTSTGNALVADGSAASPSMAFATTPNMGWYRSGANIGASFAGALRYYFSNVGIYTTVTGSNFFLGHIGAASRLSLTSRMDGTGATSALPGITFAQHANLPFIGASQPQILVQASAIVNQTGTSSFSLLDLNTTETAVGSGAQYIINAKAGAAGTTQMFAVTNVGGVLAGASAAGVPAISFVGAPTTGLRDNSGSLTVVATGIDRWQFNGSSFQSLISNSIIEQVATNGAFTMRGRVSFTSANPSLLITNNGAFSAGAGSQVGLELDYTLAQTATAGFAALSIDVTGTSGSGSQSLIDGQWGGSQVFRVTNAGRVYTGAGTNSLPGWAFTTDGNTGAYLAANDDLRLVTTGTDRLSISTTQITPALHVVPDTHNTRDLGSAAIAWRTAYVGFIGGSSDYVSAAHLDEVYVGAGIYQWPYSTMEFHVIDFTPTTLRYMDNGSGVPRTNPINWPLMRYTTLSNFGLYVTNSSTSAETTVEVFINNTGTGMKIAVPAGATGFFNTSDVVAANYGDRVDLTITGGGSGKLTCAARFELVATSP